MNGHLGHRYNLGPETGTMPNSRKETEVRALGLTAETGAVLCDTPRDHRVDGSMLELLPCARRVGRYTVLL